MIATRTDPNADSLLWLQWTAAAAIGWTLSSMALGSVSIRTPPQLLAAITTLAIAWAVLGAFTGLLQSLAFRSAFSLGWQWVLASLLAHGVGFGLGASLSAAAASVTWPVQPPPFLQGGSWFLILSPFNAAALAGLLIGLTQWLQLRRRLPAARTRQGLLWVLGTIAGLGLAILAGSVAQMIGMAIRGPGLVMTPGAALAGRLVAGAVYGMITGGILVILRRAEIQARAAT